MRLAKISSRSRRPLTFAWLNRKLALAPVQNSLIALIARFYRSCTQTFSAAGSVMARITAMLAAPRFLLAWA